MDAFRIEALETKVTAGAISTGDDVRIQTYASGNGEDDSSRLGLDDFPSFRLVNGGL